MSTPRFIFFDLGNVLLSFDHAIARRRLAEVAEITPADFDSVLFDSGLQRAYELGSVTTDDFAQRVSAEFGLVLDHTTILEYCSDIFSVNAPIIPVVAHLKTAGYPLGILSNTCEAHWDFIASQPYAFLRHFFPIRVLSYEQRSMKPDSRIYEAAARAAGVPIEKILFIDDRPENVAGAHDAGMDAVQFDSVSQLIQDLSSRGVETNL